MFPYSFRRKAMNYRLINAIKRYLKMFVQEETSIYFAVELSLREISYVVYERALMTQKSCAVVMRNAT